MEGEIYIGNKEIAVYLGALMIQSENHNSVIIKARGRAISKAVDVSQIAIHKELPNWKIEDIKIGTNENNNLEEDKIYKVSFIEITISK